MAISIEIGWFDSKNATKAKTHEYGTPKVPRRPHLYKVFQSNEFKNYYNTPFMNDLLANDLEKGLNKIGQLFIQYYKTYVLGSRVTPPLSPQTIKIKQQKGSLFPTIPLVDTLEMLNAIQFKVHK